MTGSLDTNVVLRLLLGDIPEQYLLAQKLVETSPKPLGVADIVFVELEYALSTHYKMTREQVYSIMTIFIAHPKINCNRAMLSRTFEKYKTTASLSFIDIVLSVYADLSNQKPLWTFDKKLANQSLYAELLKD